MVEIASSAPETTWLARARCVSSASRASSNSALARMIPSWLFSRWKTAERSGTAGTAGPVETPGTPSECSGATAKPLVPSALCLTGCWIWTTPERVLEDADRTAGSTHVLNLAAGDPVVDRPPAHTDELARSRNRYRFSVNQHGWFHPCAGEFGRNTTSHVHPEYRRWFSGL